MNQENYLLTDQEYQDGVAKFLSNLKEIDFLDLVYSKSYYLYTEKIKPFDETTRGISYSDLENMVDNVKYCYKDLHKFCDKLIDKAEKGQNVSKELIHKITDYFFQTDDINLKEYEALVRCQEFEKEKNVSLSNIKNKI